MAVKFFFAFTLCVIAVLADSSSKSWDENIPNNINSPNYFNLLKADDGNNGPLSNDCMSCLCQAYKFCPADTTGCTDSCGPFAISYGYWRDTFSRGPNEHDEYYKCTENVWCSVRTVQAHMRRFLPNCLANSGSRSVCETALALHTYGGASADLACTRPLANDAQQRLRDCMARLAWNRISKDFNTKRH